MKKNILMVCGVLSLLFRFAIAGQSIQIHAELPMNSPAAEFLLLIQDNDFGTKTAVNMLLRAGQNLQTFSVRGEHYQVIPLSLTAGDMRLTPCAPSALISGRSLIMTMNGNIASEGLHCVYRETASLPQLYTPALKTSTGVAKQVAAQSADLGYSGVVNYLTQLSRGCEVGTFRSTVAKQLVTYSILGMKEGICQVSISTDPSKKPLNCLFRSDDIALIAAPSRIRDAEQGQLNYSDSDLVTRIMKARCH